MKSEKIAEKFMKGIDCSQVITEHFADEMGISAETAKKMAACFGGGMSMGGTCGAVTGALIVLGMKYGHFEENDAASKDIMAAKRAEFLMKYNEKYSSTVCNDLLNHDITKPEEFQKILDEGLLFNFCPKVVEEVIEILKEI